MALSLLAANNAQTVLAAGISSTATSLTVSTGTGTLFPSPVAGTSFFKLTIIDAATGSLTEIVHVTARAGDVFTIQRGQEGTVPRAWSANDIAANMMTAGTLSYILGNFQPLDPTLTALAALVGVANKLPYFNGDDTAALTDLTQVGRDIIGKNTIADILTYLGLSNVIYGGFDGDDIARPYMWYSTTGQSVYLTTNVFLSSELDKKQPLDATLTALAGLTNGANKLPYFTGADQMATADLSAFIRTMLGKADAAAVLAYLGIPDALALKADLSSFHTTRSNTFIAANQPFTGASSGVLRFMCGEFTGTTDKDGNLTVTLPDTYLGKIIYAEAHQFNGGYAGNTDPLIFSSYILPNTAAASVTFAVRNTKTGMAAGNVQLSCLYFTRGV
ncbi:hypothetical protein [Citrobacter freundii]|uniref:hypothetical protein n=1 Tax=Citrobacter freundii TaxID=546 RepID=UPI004042701F